MRTINTHLADGYDGRGGGRRWPRRWACPTSEVAAGPAPLFDWEVRSGTTIRIQDSLVVVGGVGYERPTGETASSTARWRRRGGGRRRRRLATTPTSRG